MFVLAAAGIGQAQDAAVTDPGFCEVIFENDRVHVLNYQDRPGDKTSLHAHPVFLVYALTAVEQRLTPPDGTVLNRTFLPGQLPFFEARALGGENVSTTDGGIEVAGHGARAVAPCRPGDSAAGLALIEAPGSRSGPCLSRVFSATF